MLAASPAGTLHYLLMVKLEVDNEKYVIIDRAAKTVNFYNLDHTFWKSVSFALATDLNPNHIVCDILYISQHLFDKDDEIEFMYVDQYFNMVTHYFITQIINEDGALLFSENGAPLIKINFQQQQLPIYNTSLGTKLILSMTNGDANVYSLDGYLSASILNNTSDEFMLGVGYPNPSTESMTIPYSLPDNELNGTIKIYDSEGREVRSVSVNRNSTNITLPVNELGSGIYYYQLWTSKGQSGAKKMIKIE
jgi:hypothetical protein